MDEGNINKRNLFEDSAKIYKLKQRNIIHMADPNIVGIRL